MAFRAMGLAPLDDVPTGRVSNPPKFDPTPYQQAAQRFATPPELKDAEHKVFVSRMVAYFPKDGTVGPVSPDLKDPSGITIQWKLDHKFNIEDPSVAQIDSDKDGFTNLEEFKAGTTPRDPESRPSLLLKLRVDKYQKVPFRVILRGYNVDGTSGQMIFQLGLLDVKTGKSRMVKEGDQVEGYKVGAFRKKIVTRMNESTKAEEQVDESELDLINQRMGETVVLIRNKEIESDESYVVLRVDSPQGKVEPSRVVRGEKFKLDGKEYQLIKPTERTVSIKDLETGKIIENIGG